MLAAINTCANIKPRYGMASELVLHGEALSPIHTTLPVLPSFCGAFCSCCQLWQGSHYLQVQVALLHPQVSCRAAVSFGRDLRHL